MKKTSNISKKPDLLNRVGTMAKPFVYLRIAMLSLICFILFGVIIYFSFFFRKNYIKGRAKVLNHKCKTSFDKKGNTKTNCIYNIRFKASNGKTYTATIDGGKQRETNDMMDISYDPKSPKSTVSTVFNKLFVIGVSIFVLIMLLITLVFNVIYRNNKLLGIIDAYKSI